MSLSKTIISLDEFTSLIVQIKPETIRKFASKSKKFTSLIVQIKPLFLFAIIHLAERFTSLIVQIKPEEQRTEKYQS